MFTSAPHNIVDSSDIVSGIYIDILASYVHLNQLAYMKFKWNICCWHIYGDSMVKKSCLFLSMDIFHSV